MNRREFLIAGGILATTGIAKHAFGSDTPKSAEGPLEVGAPCLQAPAGTTMGISWRVSGLSRGAVEYADNPRFDHAKTATGLSAGYGLIPLDDKALQVRLEGLKPGKKYYYRTVTTPFAYRNAYNAQPGEPIVSATHAFTTPGKNAKAHFCMFSDTHADWKPFQKVVQKTKELKPAAIVWNGDATNSTQDKKTAVEIFLDAPIQDRDFAADLPTFYVSGNHDFRGSWISRREEVVLPRNPSERSGAMWDLKWNFAERLGEMALIGLDTGEDKPDAHPKWMGLANYSPYRQKQAVWLEDVLKRPDIAKAKYKVVFCHIPLFADPTHKDYPKDGVKIDPNDYAYWSRECNELWGPILTKHKVNLVVCGHRHRFRFDPATKERPWAQVLGGGHDVQGADKFPTVVEGLVEHGAFRLRVHDVEHDTIVFDEKIA